MAGRCRENKPAHWSISRAFGAHADCEYPLSVGRIFSKWRLPVVREVEISKYFCYIRDSGRTFSIPATMRVVALIR